MRTKCPRCGKKHNGNFCTNCGTPAQQPQVQKKKELKAWQIILIVLGAHATLMAILVGIGSAVSPSGSSSVPAADCSVSEFVLDISLFN